MLRQSIFGILLGFFFCFLTSYSSCFMQSTFVSKLLCFTYNKKEWIYFMCIYVVSAVFVVGWLLFCCCRSDSKLCKNCFAWLLMISFGARLYWVFAYFRSCRSVFSSFLLIHVVVGRLTSCDQCNFEMFFVVCGRQTMYMMYVRIWLLCADCSMLNGSRWWCMILRSLYSRMHFIMESLKSGKILDFPWLRPDIW